VHSKASVRSLQAIDRRLVRKERRRLQAYFWQAVGDLLAISVAYLAANFSYLGYVGRDQGMVMLLAIAPIYFAVAVTTRAYSGIALVKPGYGIMRAINSLLVAIAAVLLLSYLLKAGAQFSRGVFGIGGVGSIGIIVVMRLALHLVFRRRFGGSPYSTVVIVDGVDYQPAPYDMVLHSEALGFHPHTSDPVDFHLLAEAVTAADRVIVATVADHYVQWSMVLKSMAINGEIVTDEIDQLGIIRFATHGGHRTIVVAAGPLHIRERMLKRGFDLLLSITAVIVLSPIMLLIALAVKVTSPGKVLFTQDRIGRDNKLFKMYKFRSMYSVACDATASQLTSRNDVRVTKVGNFIRRTSLDELPQLFNVVIGNMSIVGPRPHATAAKAADLLYWDVDPRYRHRHVVKPGLTGLAQVRGFRGATDRTEDLSNRLSADLEYVASWSLRADVMIILQTMFVIFHKNAY
jgi:exopolysaccharide biosynthesis polyprenyl glycosylphosphotransferase